MENEKTSKESAANPMTEKRTALIAALIAVPAAFLIGMLIHYFVPVPEGSLFSCQTNPQENANPRMQRGQRAGASKAAAQDLTALYKKKISLLEEKVKTAQMSKAGKLNAECALRLAEGDLFRYEKKIRRWGNSVSDLAVRFETAKKIAALAVGNKSTSAEVRDAAIEAVDLEIQLKSHRTFSNEEWQKAYDAYTKNPDSKNYRAMLEAEQAAQPPRKF